MTTKCVIYRRYSSDEQGKGQGETLVTQLNACEAYAARKGWDVSDILTDEGFSAFKGDHLRPPADLAKFVNRVMTGEIEPGTILLAYRQSRLSRLPVDQTMVWIHSLTSRGIGIAFADKDSVFKANPTLEEYIGMALPFAVSNKESADKSDNVRAARFRMWEKAESREGKWVNLATRIPSWLMRNEQRNGWIIHEHRARLIRDIYQWSADGMGAVLITNRLNEIGEPSWGIWQRYKDQKWGRSAVRQLLQNPAVEGDFAPSENGVFEGKVLHEFYPRIVEADLVAKARGQHARRVKRSGQWTGELRNAPAEHGARKVRSREFTAFTNLFAGLTFCGECGKRAFISSSITKGRYYPYIRCEGAYDNRCGNKGYYPYAAFEATALDLCLDLALDDHFFEATGELRESQRRKAELEKAIIDTRKRRTRWMDDYERPDQEPDPDIRQRIAELKAKIDALTEEMARVEALIQQASGKVTAVEHLQRVTDIREATKSSDELVRQQARGKLKLAFSAILNSVEIDRTSDGLKVFRLAFLGGILGVQIDTKGKVLGVISEAVGKPLHHYLTPEQWAMAEPLIRRIEGRRALEPVVAAPVG